MQRERHLLFCAETPLSSLGLKLYEMDRKTVETCFLVRRVHVSACFGKNGHWILHAKDEKDHPDCYQRKVQKSASVMVWGCISVQIQRLMLEFWRVICCRQGNNFSQELHVYFSRTMPGLILHELQQCGFVGR